MSQTKEETFMSLEESFTTHCTNSLSYSNQWIRLWTVCSDELLTFFDGVAINPSIFTQEPSMLGYEKNATRFYTHSIFPCLQAVIPQNLSLDVILKYSRCFPPAVPTFMNHIKIYVNGSEFGTTITNPGPVFIVCDLNQASPNPPPT